MSDKFVKNVNAPFVKLNAARNKAIRPAARAGIGVAAGAYWLIKYLLLTNAPLRRVEDKLEYIEIKNKSGKINKFKAFNRRFPNFSAHLYYYMLLAGLVFGGAKVVQNDNQKDKKDKTEFAYAKQNIENFSVNPTVADAEWEKQVGAIHPYVLAHIISSEGFIARAYYDNDAGGTITIGSGFTINDNRHRKFAAKVLGRNFGNGSVISPEENRRLVSAWMFDVVYPKIKKNFTVPLDSRLFEILAVAAYNRGESTFDKPGNTGYPVRAAVNAGAGRDEIISAYVRAFAGIRGTKWGGLANKYGVAAMYYLGDISNETILNAIAEAPYAIERHIKTAPYNGRLLTYAGDSKFARANGVHKIDGVESLLLKTKRRMTKGTRQEPVKNYMTQLQVETIIRGGLFDPNTADWLDFSSAPVASRTTSEKLNNDGETLFFDKDYAGAIEKFNAALKQDPKNYIVYSNLAIAYYKLGDYAAGLKVVQDLLSSKYLVTMPADVRAYTYYNAALCREALGDNAINPPEKISQYVKARDNMKLSEQWGGESHDVFMTRIDAKINDVQLNNVKNGRDDR